MPGRLPRLAGHLGRQVTKAGVCLVFNSQKKYRLRHAERNPANSPSIITCVMVSIDYPKVTSNWTVRDTCIYRICDFWSSVTYNEHILMNHVIMLGLFTSNPFHFSDRRDQWFP